MATQPQQQWQWAEELDWQAQQLPPDASSIPLPPEEIVTTRDQQNDGRQHIFGAPRATEQEQLTDEDDPLSDEEADAMFPEQEPLLIEDVPEDENDDERQFMAVKPWLGAIHPPSQYIKDPENPHKLFTEDDNNWSKPEVSFDLDYIFGYRARNCRDNLHWVDEDHVVFPAAAVGVVLNLKTTDEDFYFGHDDDIVCLDYHKEKRLVASGSIGSRNTVRLCVWSTEPPEKTTDPFKTIHCITGFHMFAVLSVAFNPSGTIIASVGMDEHHSVALYSVASGQLLAFSASDKNRLVHCRFNTASTVDPETHFVTVGVRHISFWTPKDTTLPKGKNYYFSSGEELDQRMDWQRGFGCEEIQDEGFCFYSLDFSPYHAIVGASNGCLYMFNALSWNLQRKLNVCTKRILTIQCLNEERSQFAVGSGAGKISMWNVGGTEHDIQIEPSKAVLPLGDSMIDANLMDEATDNPSDVLVNSVRSLCFDRERRKLLVGTILSHVYSVDLTKSTLTKPSYNVLLGGHWGCLGIASEYGEIWGVDSHPKEQWVITCSDDGTVRLWDLIDNKELARRHLKYRAFKCSFSQDGTMVAVGHRNGSFTVCSGDLKEVIWPNTRHRKGRVCDIQFSPSSEFLAIAADQYIDVYRITPTKDEQTGKERKHFRRIGICRGHTSYLKSFDWNVSSTAIQSCSKGYEYLCFAVPDCARIANSKAMADEVWFSQTCIIGWGVQGIWPRFADGSDINSVGKSRSHQWLTVTDDWGRVKMYNYPCIGGGLDRRTGQLTVRPDHHTYVGHCSHVTNCIWTHDDTYCCTTGGGDLCMFCWKVNYGPKDKNKPKKFYNAEMIDGIKAHVKAAQERKEAGLPPDEGSTMYDGTNTFTSEATSTGTYEPIPGTQAPSNLPPPECFMCGYAYPNINIKKCPRCFAPRRKATAQPARAWTGNRAEKSPVRARFLQPTTTFARYTRAQQGQRKDIEEAPKKHVWMPGSMSRRTYSLGIEISDSDEEDCRQTVMSVKSTTSSTASKKKKSAAPKKKCAGPDFADF